MMPASFQLKAVPVATPLLNEPNAPEMEGLLLKPNPVTRVGVSETLSGLVSLPKLGVVVPLVVVAVTVTLNASPALTNLAPAALDATGFTQFGKAVCLIPLNTKPPGLTTKALETPSRGEELTVAVANNVTCPTSLYNNVTGAFPFESKVKLTPVALAKLPLLLRATVVAVPPFILIRLAA